MLYTAYARVVPCAYRFVPSTPNAIVIADRIFRDLFFIGLSLVIFRSQELRRMLDAANSKKIEQLRRDPDLLSPACLAVFFFENTKVVQFNSSKQRAVNGAHDLCGRHRAAILGRKLRLPRG
jgi:hypothetical protein